jgi:iron-sulfur cluster repair protein YtfE (RIC family)
MVMRDEHREILDCLDRIQASITDPASTAESVRHALHLVLGNHNLKEENIVYPMTDQALGAEARDALVAADSGSLAAPPESA